jgi:hypothetical protein
MKRVIFSSLIIVLVIGSCAKEKKSSIEGIWKLTFGRWYNWNPNDTLTYQFPGNINIYHIKIFSKRDFTFVGHTVWIP